MADIVACVNLKGGVGKTALAVNFAAYCGLQDLSTLLIDLDPQTNATFSSYGFEEWSEWTKENGTIADILGARKHTHAEDKDVEIGSVIIEGVFKNVDLIPSHLDLFTIDLDMAGAAARERKLKRALKSVENEYDIIICDCPPNLTIPTQNALAASSHYVIPVSPDFLSSIGIALLMSRISEFSADMEHQIELAGIALSRVGRPSEYRTLTKDELRSTFGESVFQTEIKERSVVSEASAIAKSVFDMKNADAKEEFKGVSDEILDCLGDQDEDA